MLLTKRQLLRKLSKSLDDKGKILVLFWEKSEFGGIGPLNRELTDKEWGNIISKVQTDSAEELVIDQIEEAIEEISSTEECLNEAGLLDD